MRPLRLVGMVIGTLLAVIAVGLLVAGLTLGAAAIAERGDDGYFDLTLDRIETPTAALVSDELTLDSESEAPWLHDVVDLDVRVEARTADAAQDLFVGVARSGAVETALEGVAISDVVAVDDTTVTLATRDGTDDAPAPSDLDIWVASASGPGSVTIEWEARGGDWTLVVMNADGSSGVAADVTVGVRSGLIVPISIGLVASGAVALVLAVFLIAVSARSGADRRATSGDVVAPLPPPIPTAGVGIAARATAVRYDATIDDDLSRWKWLVKWLLALPHWIVLLVLWITFVILTAVAWFSIVFTRRYPQRLFDVNVGILRWTWRVSHYCSTGGLATDRYPSFGLAHHPGDAVNIEIERPAELSRWLPFVKLVLALPHLLVVGVLAGSSIVWFEVGPGTEFVFGTGLLGALVLAAGVMLLVTGRYPAGLYDVVAGCNRWVLRVVAYVALMTDDYPPFRLDQGEHEPIGAGPDEAGQLVPPVAGVEPAADDREFART